MNSAEQLTSILVIVLMVLLFILLLLAATYVIMRFSNKKKDEKGQIKLVDKQVVGSDARKIAKEYTKESIFNFMDFDKVEDNMIIQKDGKRYLMVVECQGINYDLMSEAEKISVEEGFLQFLNTLRDPIQIYIQTRTVNLNNSIENYKRKLQEIETELEKKKSAYNKNVQSGNYTKEELEKEFYELTKQTNLYEYGKDIIANTQRMSLNKNVLNKKYYIIISCYPEELANGAFDKEELKNLAFAELYTKAQSIIRTIARCEVTGKIMESNELVELLYVAYNRDESEVFSLDRAVQAGYEELYTTAPDVLDKKMRSIDEEIERKAISMVNDKVLQVRSKKQQQIEQKQNKFEELVRQHAEMILRQNASYLGEDTSNQAIELIEEEGTKNKKSKDKGGDANVGQETKGRARGRKPKVAK